MKKGLKIMGFGLAVCALVPGVVLGVGCGDKVDDGIKVEDGISVSGLIGSYYQGQDLDVTGGLITYTKNGATTFVNIRSDMISNFDSSEVGSSTMTITYAGYQATVDYSVSALAWSGTYTCSNFGMSGSGTLEILSYNSLKLSGDTYSYKPTKVSERLVVTTSAPEISFVDISSSSVTMKVISNASLNPGDPGYSVSTYFFTK